jgi:radical SAM superfamily enzyme YgiQ (UPF0313 family)
MNNINIWFVNPWITDFTAFDLWSKPLGLLYIASFLREYANIHPVLVDVMDRNHPFYMNSTYTLRNKKYGIGSYPKIRIEKPEILKDIPRYYSQYGMPDEIFTDLLNDLARKSPPDMIFMTTLMTYWYPGAVKMATILKEKFPNIPLVVGGVYVTLMPDHARNHIPADHFIEGPGEIQALNLLKEYFPKQVKNIPLPESIDDFPWPAFDLYKTLPYLIVMTSRGCPYRCSFCASHIVQPGYQHRNYEKVAEEILTQSRKFKIRDIAFYDDALLVDRERHIKPLLRLLFKKTRKLRYHTPNGIHGKYIDEELAELMALNNFKTIRISYEYFDENRKKDISFKITNEEFERSVRILEKAGFKRKNIESYIIMGLPGQSLQNIIESMLFVHKQGIKIRLASFSPIPGTIDYQRAIEAGIIPQDIDPLLCNKSIFPLHKKYYSYETYHKLRQLVNILNEAANREINLIDDAHLGKAFFDAMGHIEEYANHDWKGE